MARTNEVGIFCSYSHIDEELRRELFAHLYVLKLSGVIKTWYDGQITAGEQWNEVIERELHACDIVLLLVSVDLLNSEFVSRHELPIALARHHAGQSLIIPVLLRPVAWNLSGLDSLQALPEGLKPVVLWNPRDLAWVSICEGLVKAILVWRKGSTPPPPAEPERLATRRRVVDLGLPREVPIGLSTVLAVMVRRPESSGLAGVFDLEVQYGVKPDEVRSSESFSVPFPRAPDGSLKPVDFEIALETTDFTCAIPVKPLTVPPRGDSEICVFLLTAKHAGKLLVNVELRHDGKRVAGSLLRASGVPGATFQPAIQASLPVEMTPTRRGVSRKLQTATGIAASLVILIGIAGIWRQQPSAGPLSVELPSEARRPASRPPVEAPVKPDAQRPRQERREETKVGRSAGTIGLPRPATRPPERVGRAGDATRVPPVITMPPQQTPAAQQAPPRTGTLTWSGVLPPGGELVIDIGGRISSGRLAGTIPFTSWEDVQITGPREHLKLALGSVLTITNTGESPVYSIELAWQKK